MSGIALTFDDGPDAVWTRRLLDLLARAQARASFFPIASRAAAHPELILRMLEEGHSVELHCHQHIRHRERDPGWLRRDTGTALAVLSRMGAEPRFWRVPWGQPAPWTAEVAREHGLELVGWNCDSHDWRGDSAVEMYAATRAGLLPGAVVLAHDGIGPGARRDDAAETFDYTRLVIDHARRHGLCLERLDAVTAA